MQEPLGGAHRSSKVTIKAVGETIDESLQSLMDLDGETLKKSRREKFLKIGSSLSG